MAGDQQDGSDCPCQSSEEGCQSDCCTLHPAPALLLWVPEKFCSLACNQSETVVLIPEAEPRRDQPPFPPPKC